jgi:hypothetical protein
MRAYYETLSKEDLIDTLLKFKAKYEAEKLEAEWLDETITALRYDEDEPDSPSEEIKMIKQSYNEHIINENLKL